MIPRRLSAVTLGARDLPRLAAFYRTLGFEAGAHSSDGFASFLLGGVVLALYPADRLGAEGAPGRAAPDPGAWNGLTLGMNVERPEEVDRVWAEAVAAGAEAVAEPQDREWGGRSGYWADPEGHPWEVAWAPGLRFDERGAVIAF